MLTDLRAAGSDAHVLGDDPAHPGVPDPTEPCDRDKVRRLVADCIARHVVELHLVGDDFDLTRRGLDGLPSMARFWVDALRPAWEAGIAVLFHRGNHEGSYAHLRLIMQALYAAGATMGLVNFTHGPTVRGRWWLEHLDRFDPWNAASSWQHHVAEMMTRLDWALDHLHVDLEAINPAEWRPEDGAVPALDFPLHHDVMRWAAVTGWSVIGGHSHYAAEVGGRVGGQEWKYLNCGALIKSAPYTCCWFTDDGRGGLVVDNDGWPCN